MGGRWSGSSGKVRGASFEAGARGEDVPVANANWGLDCAERFARDGEGKGKRRFPSGMTTKTQPNCVPEVRVMRMCEKRGICFPHVEVQPVLALLLDPLFNCRRGACAGIAVQCADSGI